MMQVPLTQGRFALIDDEDSEVLAFKWYAVRRKNTWYAVREVGVSRRKRWQLPIHREILGLQYKDGIEVDHINGNGLDNRRENLRIVTRSQNQMNRKPKEGASSRYKGVHWSDTHKRWQATAQLNGQRYHLGFWVCEEDAALAYNMFAAQHFGEYARLNEV